MTDTASPTSSPSPRSRAVAAMPEREHRPRVVWVPASSMGRGYYVTLCTCGDRACTHWLEVPR